MSSPKGIQSTTTDVLIVYTEQTVIIFDQNDFTIEPIV